MKCGILTSDIWIMIIYFPEDPSKAYLIFWVRYDISKFSFQWPGANLGLPSARHFLNTNSSRTGGSCLGTKIMNIKKKGKPCTTMIRKVSVHPQVLNISLKINVDPPNCLIFVLFGYRNLHLSTSCRHIKQCAKICGRRGEGGQANFGNAKIWKVRTH